MAGDSLPKYLSGKWGEIKDDIRVYRYETKTPPSSEQSSPTGPPNQKLTIPSLKRNENRLPAKDVTSLIVKREMVKRTRYFPLREIIILI